MSKPIFACPLHRVLKRSRISRFGKVLVLSLGLTLAGGPRYVRAANDAWSTAPASGNFSGINWTTGATVPGAATGTIATGDVLYFGASSITTLDDDEAAGFNIGGLIFNAGAAAFTIGDSNAFVHNLTGNITNNGTNTETINDLLAFTAVRTVTMTTGGGNVTLGGNLSGTGGGLTLAGTGTLTLSGNNSFTGGVTVNSTGILQLQANAANTTAGVTSVLPTQNFTLAQLGAGGGGTIQLRADSTVASGGVVAFDSAATTFGTNVGGQRLSGVFNFDVNRLTTGTAQTLQFGAPNSTWYVGTGTTGTNTTVNVTGGNGYTLQLGTFLLGNNYSITYNATTANLIVGGITNGSTGTVTVTGGGTVFVNGAANAYTGGTIIGAAQGAAVLRAGTTGALGTGTITLDASGNASTARLELTGGITLANAIAFTARANTSAGIESVSGNNILSGLMTLGVGGGFYTVQSDAGTLALTNTGTTTISASKTFTLQGAGNGTAATVFAGGGGVTKAGAGTWALTGTSTYTGPTTISVGTLQLGNGGTTGALATGSAITDNATLAFNRTNTVTEGTDLATVITGSGGITQAGAGTVVLTGTNTYAGTTVINTASTLQLGNGASGGDGTIASTSGVTDNGTLVYNRFGTTTAGYGISGTGAVTKSGAGTQILSGTSSYTGATTINAGTLAISGTIDSTTGGVAVNAGGTLAGPTASGGTGTILGAVTVAGGTSAATQGAINLVNNSLGTLNTGNLTLGGTTGNFSQVSLDANGSGSDTVALGGNTFTVNAGGAQITLNNVAGGIAAGETFNLLTYTAGTGAGFSIGTGTTVGALTLTNSNISFGVTAALNVTGTAVQVITSGAPAPTTAYFSGAQGAAWTAIDGTGTKGNFTTNKAGTNFVGAYPNINTDVIFAASNATNLTSNTLGQDFTINSLSYDSTTAAVSTTGANTLTIEGGGITLQAGNGGASLGMTTLALGATQTFENDSANNLTISAAITGANALTIFNTGAGATIFSGANTFTGGLTLSGGTLRLSGSGTLGVAANSLEVDAGTLDLNGTSQTVGNLNGSGGTILNNGSTANTLTVGSGGGGGGNFSGVIADNSNAGTGTLAVTKTGAGAIEFSGANTYSGATNINGGVLQINAANNLGGGGASNTIGINGGTLESLFGTYNLGTNRTVALNGAATLQVDTGTVTVDGVVSGAGALTINGPGSLTLSVANTFSGGTTISGGTVTAGNNAALGTGAVALTPASGNATLDFITAAPTIASLASSGAGTSSVVLGNATAPAATALTVGNANTTTFGGVISDLSGTNAAATGSLTKVGAGALILSGTNTYTGATLISAGTLQLGAAGTTGSLSTASAITDNGTLFIARSNAVVQGTDFSAAAITGTGALIQAGTNTLTLNTANSYTGGTGIGYLQNNSVVRATASGALGTGTITTDAAGNGSTARLEVAGGITLANAIAFTARSNATVGIENISGNNTLSGLVTLGAGGQFYDVQSDAGTLALTNAGTSTIGVNKTFTFAGAGNGTYAGVMTSVAATSPNLAGGVTKTGAGTWTVTGANTYVGATTITGGILQLGNGTTGNDGTISSTSGVADNGTLAYNRFGAGSAGYVISGTGNVTVSGPGSQTLTGASTYTGATTIAAGATLQLGNGTTGNDGTIAGTSGVTDNGTLIYNRFGVAAASYVIGGTGAVSKLGAGTQTVGGANTYSGGTTVNAGMLTVAAGASLGTGNVAVSIGSTTAGLTLTATSGTNTSNAIADSATLTLNTNGTLTLTGANGTVQETVGGLVVNGTTEPSGLYGSTTDATPGVTQLASITGTGELLVGVPEPSTNMVILAGLGGLMGIAVRRRRKV